jgi:hypothetical protein
MNSYAHHAQPRRGYLAAAHRDFQMGMQGGMMGPGGAYPQQVPSPFSRPVVRARTACLCTPACTHTRTRVFSGQQIHFATARALLTVFVTSPTCVFAGARRDAVRWHAGARTGAPRGTKEGACKRQGGFARLITLTSHSRYCRLHGHDHLQRDKHAPSRRHQMPHHHRGCGSRR